MKLKTLFLILTSLIIFGCGKSKGGGGSTSSLTAGQIAALNCFAGTWTRCSDDGSSSTMITFTVSGTRITHTTQGYNANDTCAGMPTTAFTFSGSIEMGNLGESNVSTGSTELKMTPDTDVYSCGTGQPTYSIVNFNSGCTEARLPISAPACDFASRSVVLDNQPFLK